VGTLKDIYENEKNPSRVSEIYMILFELKQGDRSVPEFYGEVKGLIDELEMHKPSVTDAATLRGYVRILQCQSFYLAQRPLYDPRCEARFWEEIAFPR